MILVWLAVGTIVAAGIYIGLLCTVLWLLERDEATQ